MFQYLDDKIYMTNLTIWEYISKLELETFETTKLTIYFAIVWISTILFAIFEISQLSRDY